MKKKRFLSLTLAACLLFGSAAMLPENAFTDSASITASADNETSGKCGENVSWSLSEDGVLTISGSGKMTNYNSYGSSPFYSIRYKITNIIIDPGVTSIGDYIFYELGSLTSITIPNSVTSIGNHAFIWCNSLTSIIIPNSVTSIGDYAFMYCHSLTSIIIPNSVTSIGDDAFFCCDSLASITIPNSVTSIGNNAFSGCESLTRITIPYSVTIIGDDAFYGCTGLEVIIVDEKNKNYSSDNGILYNKDKSELIQCPGGIKGSVTISNGVKRIGPDAFYGCTGLEVIIVDEKNKNYSSDNGILYNKDKSELIQCPNGIKGSVTISNGVKRIGHNAFSRCYDLASITIPNSVTSIGASAFEYCTCLTGVTIPKSVTDIEFYAFIGCTSLTDIIISDGVSTIESHAFADCSLMRVTIPKSVDYIGEDAFGYDWNYDKIDGFTITCYKGSAGEQYAIDNGFDYKLIPEAVHVDAKKASCTEDGNVEYWTIDGKYYSDDCCENEITLASTVIKANGHKYGEWKTVSTDTVNHIETQERICSVCKNKETKTVTISDPSLVNFSFADNADGTASITKYTGSDENVVIPEKTADGKTITKISENAFKSNDSIKTVTIPNGIKTIGKNAFKSCTKLISVTLPDSVTNIEEYALFDCTALRDINIPKGVKSIGDYALGYDSYYDRTEFLIVKCYNDSVGKKYAEDNLLDYEILDPETETGSEGPFDYIILEDGTVELTKYNLFEYVVKIPSELGGRKVTSIGKEAFKGEYNLSELTIPEGVTKICAEAFANTPLRSVTIPESVTSIGDKAFYQTLVKSITIPKNVTSIGDEAFYYCPDLESVTILGSLESFGEKVFCMCGLKSVTFGKNVKCIGKEAFSQCLSLDRITIPGNIKDIGDKAFSLCNKLTDLTLEKGVENIGKEAFNSCYNLKNVIMQEGVKNIGDRAFYYCSSLKSISIPSSVTSFGENAFEGTPWLAAQKELYPFFILNGVLISADAKECTGKVVIPDNVTKIAPHAFYNNIHMTEVTIPSGVTSIGNGAFYSCLFLEKVKIPDSVASIGDEAFSSTGISSIVIPGSVKRIGKRAFFNCLYLADATMNDGVEVIDDEAFYVCPKLENVTIPNSVKTIGENAFADTGLKGVIIPKSVTQIGRRAFGYQNDVRQPNFRISVYKNTAGEKYAKNYGFTLALVNNDFECQKLNDGTFMIVGYIGKGGAVKVPASIDGTAVSCIGDMAFNNCDNITSVTIENGIKSLGQGTFGLCKNLKSITIPESITNLENAVFAFSGLESVNIPKSITTIGENAFYGCSNLKEVTLQFGVESIGNSAFAECVNLKSITVPASVRTIDDYAFIGCQKLTLKVRKNTAGEKYAKYHGFDYVLLDVEHVKAKKATCTQDGTIEYWIYNKKFYSDAAATKEIAKESIFVKATGHQFGEWKQTKAPSCTEKGEQIRECKACAITETKIIDALGHKWSEWKTTAFDVKKGRLTQIRTCSVCNKTETKKTENAIQRLAGAGRYATAVEISKAGFPDGSDTVVLAYGLNYADALAGVSLAKAKNAPILLTNLKTLPAETLAEIKRLKAKNVIILGGEGAVGAEVETALKKEGLKTERIAGATRFETATKIAEKMQKLSGKTSEDVFFVYAFNSADALSVSAVAAVKGAPVIYLKTKGELDDATADYLKSVKGSVKNAYVIGGSGVISDDMMKKAGSALGVTPTRVFGANRFETCVAVNEKFKDTLSGDSLCVATGMDFPDALAGGVFAALNKAPLFLINGKAKTLTLSDDQKSLLKTRAPEKLYVFGGTGVVPDSHVQTVAKASV